MVSHSGFICISLMISDIEHLFMCLLVIGMSSLKNAYSGPLPIFKLGYIFDVDLYEFLHILDINPLSYHLQISSPFNRLPFCLLIVSVAVQKHSSLI